MTPTPLSPAETQKTALILGASGLVGGHCLDYLLSDPLYRQITLLVRRPLPIEHPKLKQQTIDFERMQAYADFFNVNHVFCCMGVKGAASEYEFKQVELGYPLLAAKLASRQTDGQFLIVTAMLASPRAPSALFRYKGILEAEIKKLPLHGLHIFKPSLIVGQRKIRRPDEEMMAAFFKKITFFCRPLRKYLYVEARAIAFSMVATAKENRSGIHIYNINKIQAKSGLKTA